MPLAIDLIIYDLDGTLIDSADDITNAVNFMRKSLKLKPLKRDVVIDYIGSGVRSLVERSLGPKHIHLADQALPFLKRHYTEHLLDCTKLYPLVRETLEHFSAKKQAIVTNKPEAFSIKILDGLKVRKFFSLLIGGDSGFPKKPAPNAIFHAIKSCNASLAKTLIVGDSAMDIMAGKQAGIKTCAVTYGFTKPKAAKNLGADFIIDSLEELKTLVL